MNLDTLPSTKPRLIYSWDLERWISNPKYTSLLIGDRMCLVQAAVQLNINRRAKS